jgi:hypothetical protein
MWGPTMNAHKIANSINTTLPFGADGGFGSFMVGVSGYVCINSSREHGLHRPAGQA